MPHSRALAPGTMVARDWRIERMLGQGGFGVTYEARNATTGAHVALKEYMPSGLCTRIEGSTKVTPAQGPAGDVFKRGLASFMKEADTLARLDHPSIVRVSGYFEANETAYMALAYEPGGTVADWLKRLGHPPSQVELDHLLWPLIDALIQVHSLPLLHRDIKPDNIMLRGDRTPVLIDFGAVKNLVSSDSRSIHGPATLNFVTDGYAPPEQYVSEGDGLLGPWTDVYALGATLYEAVTGGRPTSATRRMVDEIHRPLEALSRDQIGSGWRPSFLDGVDKALALKRSDRPQSMVEFRRAIGLIEAPRGEPTFPTARIPTQAAPRFANEREPRPVTFGQIPTGTKPPEPSSRSKASLGIAAALAATLLAGGAWWVVQQQAPKVDPAVQQAETARRIAEAKAAELRAEAEARRIAAENAKAAEAERQRIAAEAKRRADEEARRRDPILALAPGSGQSARDRLADGGECTFCPELVVVPAGSFTMGSTPDEIARVTKEVPSFKSWFDAEGPQRRVSIAKPFAVGKFEVTFAEWDACADARACSRQPEDQGWGRGRQPVIYVSWDEITKEYLPWLSRTTGRTYRLLTEAEWEYAARATTTTRYSFGDTFSNAQANNDKGRTVLVGQYPANLWGLHDMHGNAWEWVQDCYTDTYNGAPTDGTAGAEIVSCRRVVRGGSWDDNPQNLRSADRSGNTTDYRNNNLSFRLARTLNP